MKMPRSFAGQNGVADDILVEGEVERDAAPGVVVEVQPGEPKLSVVR